MGPKLPQLWHKDGVRLSSGMLDRLDRPPPEFEFVKEPRFGKRITDWSYIVSSPIAR
jgi:hypothetical protein